MKENENLILQGLKLEIVALTVEVQKLATRVNVPAEATTIPEWVTLEMAAELKGGGALSTYRTRLFLQPCCGCNSKLVSGRKCWKRSDVMRWLTITDADLKKYGDEWGVTIPANYKDRSE